MAALPDDLALLIMRSAQRDGAVRAVHLVDAPDDIESTEIQVTKTPELRALASTCHQYARLSRAVLREVARRAHREQSNSADEQLVFVQFHN